MLKSSAIILIVGAMLAAASTASAEIVKINVGPTLNPFFLRLVCNRVAGERGGRLVRSERSGPNKNGVCYVDIPRRSGGIVATPGTLNPTRPTQQPTTIRSPLPQAVQQQGTIRQPVPQAVPNATSRIEMVNVGRLWSQLHAAQRCEEVALSKNASWTGIWKKHDARSEAQCQLRKKPEFVLRAVSTSKIWSDSHAQYQCPRVAQANGGVWAGSWQADPKDANKARCMVRVKIVPMTVKAFVTTKIWSDAHAKKHCNELAQRNRGEWQGEWRDTQDNKNSICMIKLPQQTANNQAAAATRNTPPTPKPAEQATAIWEQNLRNVAAGLIWDQAQAERKCPVVARNAKGTWTGRWTKTGPGNESVCQVKFGGGIVAQAVPSATAKPVAQPANNVRTRNVAAGPIWDDKQAAQKCPVVAANNQSKWTGNWTKTGPGHVSVCEISTATVAAAQPKPAATLRPVQANTGSGKRREVSVGGIWDQAQAVKKCPLAATNNKGRWTGKWRKISNTNAVCEIEMP